MCDAQLLSLNTDTAHASAPRHSLRFTFRCQLLMVVKKAGMHEMRKKIESSNVSLRYRRTAVGALSLCHGVHSPGHVIEIDFCRSSYRKREKPLKMQSSQPKEYVQESHEYVKSPGRAESLRQGKVSTDISSSFVIAALACSSVDV